MLQILLLSVVLNLCINKVASIPLVIDEDRLFVSEERSVWYMPLVPSDARRLSISKASYQIRSFEYDAKHNCLLWADNQHSQIRRRCYNDTNGGSVEVLHRANNWFGYIAYDWLAEMLFFVNHTNSRIEVISTVANPPRKRFHGIIHQMDELSSPIGIAVHPRRGYLFWTSEKDNWGKVWRSNLDGYGYQEIFSSLTSRPNRLAIDYGVERIYWTDYATATIASCDFDGQHYYEIFRNAQSVLMPTALAISNGSIYWAANANLYTAKVIVRNESNQAVTFLTANDAISVTTLRSNVTYFDIRVLTKSMQVNNGFTESLFECAYAWVLTPNNTYSCLCPEGMLLDDTGHCVCPGSRVPLPDDTCPPFKDVCGSTEFACLNHRCVPAFMRCDGDNDCGDDSDEQYCHPCPPHLFHCRSDRRCIPG